MCSYLSALFFFFFNDTATTEIYTLSLHDALPIPLKSGVCSGPRWPAWRLASSERSEEHTSELQSRFGISYAVFCLKKKRDPVVGAGPGRDSRRSTTAKQAIQVPNIATYFFFNDRPPPKISLFPLPDPLPI